MGLRLVQGWGDRADYVTDGFCPVSVLDFGLAVERLGLLAGLGLAVGIMFCVPGLAQAAPGDWTTTGSLSTARQNATATLLPDGDVLVAGGYGSSGYLASAELYNPSTGTWTPTGSMNIARENATATLLADGEVLVAGGDGSGSYFLASAELYDPSTGAWRTTGSLSTARGLATATLLPDGDVLVAGGYGNGVAYLASAELYDPATGTWTTTGSLNTGRGGPVATLLPDGDVLVLGGYGSSGDLASAELYNPSTGTWTTTGSLATGRSGATATLLPDGKVLVAGGYNNGAATVASAELYAPSTGTWTTTGSLSTARSLATATLLPDGDVLVAGGVDSSGLASVELYDPSTGAWTTAGSLSTARGAATGTLLPDGDVLVAGGNAPIRRRRVLQRLPRQRGVVSTSRSARRYHNDGDRHHGHDLHAQRVNQPWRRHYHLSLPAEHRSTVRILDLGAHDRRQRRRGRDLCHGLPTGQWPEPRHRLLLPVGGNQQHRNFDQLPRPTVLDPGIQPANTANHHERHATGRREHHAHQIGRPDLRDLRDLQDCGLVPRAGMPLSRHSIAVLAESFRFGPACSASPHTRSLAPGRDRHTLRPRRSQQL